MGEIERETILLKSNKIWGKILNALYIAQGRLRKNEPFSTAERSERVENFLFCATRDYTEAGIEQAFVAMRRLGASSPEPRKRVVRE